MDDIKTRLKETSDACITKFEAWHGKTGDAAAREGLQEAVHELRKVAARIEIELAVSDRKTQGYEPIPIPSHRASRRQGVDIDLDDDNNRGQQQGGNRGGQGRDGNRAPQQQGGASRPVQIRKPESAAVAPAPAPVADGNGNDAVAEGEEGAQRKPRPLSLKRSSPDSE